MPLSEEEQRIYDWIKGGLPSWFTSTPRAEEEIGALVKVYEAARAQVERWREQASIPTAVGAVSGEPDWLNQHAKDRDTHRQDGESDEALRQRLRRYDDAVTRDALLSVVGRMLDADGVVSNDFGLVELRRDKAYFVTRQQITGTGGEFEGTPARSVFRPTTGPAFEGGMVRWDRGGTRPRLTLANCADSDNDGDFEVLGFDGDTGIVYANPTLVTGPDASCDWYINAALHGRQDSYLGRGYRLGGRRSKIITIIPYDSSEALRRAVLEAIRQRKAAGVASAVEARAVP